MEVDKLNGGAEEVRFHGNCFLRVSSFTHTDDNFAVIHSSAKYQHFYDTGM